MQSVSSRIWTRVAVSISYDDNHYTINVSLCMYSCASVFVCCDDFFTKERIIIIVALPSYLPTPPLGQDMTQGQFLSGV